MYYQPISQPAHSRQAVQSAPILFTDDQPGFLSFYRMMMRSVHMEAIYTPSTREVLQICQQQPVSLVITDVMHPEMSGIELLHQLRRDPRTANIPVILVTALDSHSLNSRLEPGLKPHGYLRKPFEPETLLDKIYSLRRGTSS